MADEVRGKAEQGARANAHHPSFFGRVICARNLVCALGERGSPLTLGVAAPVAQMKVDSRSKGKENLCWRSSEGKGALAGDHVEICERADRPERFESAGR